MADWDDMVLVGKVARPHGIRGQVIVNPETDFIDDRFRVGATVWIRDVPLREGDGGQGTVLPLTVASLRVQGGRPVVGFDGFERIEDVERLAGHELRVPEDALQPLEPGQYYHHQLVGCAVATTSGEAVGVVERIEGGIGGSRLVINGPRGEVLIPLTTAICVDIDVAAKRIRINPPEGLLDLNEVRHRHDLSADGRGRPGGRRHQPGH